MHAHSLQPCWVAHTVNVQVKVYRLFCNLLELDVAYQSQPELLQEQMLTLQC